MVRTTLQEKNGSQNIDFIYTFLKCKQEVEKNNDTELLRWIDYPPRPLNLSQAWGVKVLSCIENFSLFRLDEQPRSRVFSSRSANERLHQGEALARLSRQDRKANPRLSSYLMWVLTSETL